MDMPEYIVAGHSHMFAMGAPISYQGEVGIIKTADGRGYFLMEKWTGTRSDAYWRKLIEECAGRDILLVFNGNQHFGSFLLPPDPLFDFVDDQIPDMLEGAIVVPRRMVEAFFEPSLAQLRELIPKIIKAGARQIRIVGGPPPKADMQSFTEMMRERPFAKSLAQRRGIDLSHAEISPPLLLLKLWHVVQQLSAKVATDPRVAFVPVPPEAMDEQGYLRRAFYDYVPDHITHANSQFGVLMLKRALATLEP